MEAQHTTADTVIAPATVEGRENLDHQATTSAKLQGRWLVLARLAWLAVTVFSVGFFVISIPASYALRTNLILENLDDPAMGTADLQQFGLSAGGYAAYHVTIEVAFAVVCLVIGSMIFSRKSDDVMALLMSFFLVTFGVGVPMTLDAYGEQYPDWVWLSHFSNILLFVFLFLAFFTFPDGRFVPRWTRWVALSCIAIDALLRLLPDSVIESNILYVVFFYSLLAVTIASLAVIQIYRYRFVSNSTQRQQTKWVVYGSTIAIAGYMGVLLLSRAFTEHLLTVELITTTLSYLFLLFIPVSIGIAILRNRLFDIDIIINRTLVYIPLTAILAGVYAASIALFQKLFVATTGEESDAAIVLTTLVLTISFTPIKTWLQGIVDKRFKEAPDPAKKLRAFGKQVEENYGVLDSMKVMRRLLDEAVDALNANSGALYVPHEGQPKLAYTKGEWREGEAEITASIEHDGTQHGLIRLSQRKGGRDYTERDEKALREVAEVVAGAIGR